MIRVQHRYRKVKFTEEDFSLITENLRFAAIRSKILKLPELKKVIMSFSELRTSIVINYLAEKSNVSSSVFSLQSNKVLRPRLFKNIGGIDGLNKIFSCFFDNYVPKD